MKAEHTQQLRLLDLQALDTRLAQIAHRKAHLPAQQAVDDATTRKGALDGDLIKARTAHADLARDVTKAENDVQLVRDRAERNRARLDTGTGTAKELQGLTHELESLARRQAELENEQLEVMERAEATEALLAHLTRQAEELDATLGEARAARDSELADLETEAAEVRTRRADAAQEIDEPLLALYEKIRAQTGMGAAAVVERRCEGCRLELLGADVARVKGAPADEVVRCEECRRIMVRTKDSGL